MQKEIGWDFAAPEEDLSATAELAVKLASYCQRINAVQAPDAIDKTLVDAALDVSDAAFAASIVVPRAHDGVIAYASRGCLALSPGAFPIDALRQLLGNEPGKGPFTGPTRRLLSAERMRGLRFAGETSRFEEAIVLTLPIWEQDLVSILFVGFRKPPREIADTMEFLDAMLNVASVARWKHLPRQCSVSEHERVVRAKQEWQSSVDVLNQLICLVDRSGSVVRANRTIEQLGLGKVTDVRGRCIWELLAELDDASGRDEDSPVAVWCAELGANWTDHWQAAVDRGGIEWIVRGRAGESLYCVSINLVNMSTPYSKGVEPHAVVVVDDLSRSSSYRDRLQDVSDTPMAAIERQLEALETPDRSAFISDDLLNAQEAERSRVAIELHDGIGQMLTMMKLQCDCVIDEMNNSHLLCDPISRVRVLRESLSNSIEEVRRVSMNLRPPMLDDLGISPTLRWFFRECGKSNPALALSVDIDIDEDMLETHLETEIFRITQEAMNNIAKHAAASSVKYSLRGKGKEVLLVIEDDGIGFEAGKLKAEGAGFRNMRTRVSRSGGRFAVEAVPDAGVKISVAWQL